MPAHGYVEENGLAAMLAAKRLAGFTPEVNPGECITHTPLPSAKKAVEPRGEITRCSKQGHQWQHKKDLCPPKFFLKIIQNNTLRNPSGSAINSGSANN